MDIKTTITDLIKSKREGSYWDFKEEPHENKATLLHDILSLANTIHPGNRFIVIGVSDPKHSAQIKGLSANQANRWTQAQYVDFLNSKSFAGQCRPEIQLHTLVIESRDVDVLEIFDRPFKPYYITADYNCRSNKKDVTVKANYIYTRINDTNTSVDKSADIGIIEKMWEQRFGLDLSPVSRLQNLLMEPDEWFKDIGNVSYAYHNKFSDYRLEFSKVNEFKETFSYFFPNEKSFFGIAIFKYNSTILFELEYMFCDEMRIELPVPDTEHIKVNNTSEWYYYFDLDSRKGKFLFFLTNKLTTTSSRGSEFPFLIFESSSERSLFNKYVSENHMLLDKLEAHAGKYAKSLMQQQKQSTTIDPIFIDRILQLYKKWKDDSL